MMVDVPKLDEKGQPVTTNMPVMVDQKVEEQSIPQGPMASQVAIKMLGTNGGGYTNANAAYPFENPTPLSNFLQIPFHLPDRQRPDLYLGRETKTRRTAGRFGRDDGFIFCRRPDLLVGRGARQSHSSAIGRHGRRRQHEGKKFASASSTPPSSPPSTTDASCGAVNSMHDSYTALGGFCAAVHIQLGEIIIGGVGAGLYGMLVFCRAGGVYRGLDGRTDAGVSRQENPILRRENGHARVAGAGALDPRFRRLGVGQQMGHRRVEQRRAARFERNPLRLQLRQRQTMAAPLPG